MGACTEYNGELRLVLQHYVDATGDVELLRRESSGGPFVVRGGKGQALDGEIVTKRKYVTTIHAVVSGLIKLSRTTKDQGSTFRGISGRKMPECFLMPGPNGGRGNPKPFNPKP